MTAGRYMTDKKDRTMANFQRTGGTMRRLTFVAVLLCGTAAAAQPSTNATANLIRLLIEQKVITAEAGAALLAQLGAGR